MTTTPHDALFKAAFSKLRHARGLLRALVPAPLARLITWSTLATVWARVEVLRGREFVELRAAGSEITTRFTVRYRSDVSTVNALTWGTRQYSIVETIPVPSGRPAYLQLLGYADAT